MPPRFIHLRIHSEYSLLDGIVRIKPLVKAVASVQMPAVAITDRTNLFAAVKFYKAALAAGIKPIFGVDIELYNPAQPKKPFLMTLLCQNQVGYRNLTRLISKAYTEGQQEGFPQVQREWLIALSEGLIALSGGRLGDVGQALGRGDARVAQELAQEWKHCFPDRYYLELQRIGQPQEEIYLRAAVDLAHQCDIPVVATNDVRFLTPDDFEAHEARVCIHDGHVLNDSRRPHLYTDQQYLRTPEEMEALFADIPEALENTVEIAKRCNLEIALGKSFLPQFSTPNGASTDDYLAESARAGLELRLNILFDRQDADFHEKRRPYDERLQREVDVINGMGFASYFLIVADFIQWSKDNAIPVGPGRGSGAGSLVAYALKITDVDPLYHELLFERFLNPERVSMPDFDIDFCMDGRDRVIEYVSDHYGRESVSQIITYGTMAAKAVVRDVGRVLGHPYGFVDKLAKLIPFELGMTLEKALIQEEQLFQRYKSEEEVQILLDLAKKLEGITRNAGKHAGGIVIAPSLLTDFLPLYCEPPVSELEQPHIVTQFDKDDVESIGLVKFDFLGLRTLTIIDWAVQTIHRKQAKQGEPLINIALLPMDDPVTYAFLQEKSTSAIFQLESRGMKDLVKRLHIDNFEEIVALLALFRPGPLQSGMVDDFINRKHKRAAVEFPHPDLEAILKPTYGIILYQEQVMQIAQILANYTLGGADLLRRAMGKKKAEEMAKQREMFTDGAKARGVDIKVASYIFDLMEKFAGYGFNKSHSVAYALLTYQTAWLKAHYPAEFMAAVLSADMDHTDRVVGLVDECRLMELLMLPPSVNHSDYRFTVNDKDEIHYGLGAIKGVGEPAVKSILDTRTQEGPFRDLFDFCQRVDTRKVNRRALEALIRAGAFDGLGPHRASVMASLPVALQKAEQVARQQEQGQTDLFGLETSSASEETFSFVNTPEWTEEQRLLGEKETLGHYLSGHPLKRYEPEFARWGITRIAEMNTNRNQSVTIAGLVVAIRTLFNKRGDRMAFMTLDDRTGRIELAVFSDVYETHRELLVKDQRLVIEGDVSLDEYTGGYRISGQQVYTIAQARAKFGGRLLMKLDAQTIDKTLPAKLEQLLTPFNTQGRSSVWLEYHYPDFSTQVCLGNQWKLNLEDALIDSLQALIGEDRVVVEYIKD
jgi:DNA polymerase-3 subunit alpha